MIVYSVTVSIAKPVEQEWLKYMQEEHILDVLNTGCFKEHRIMRLLQDVQDDASTYNIQYLCESKAILNQYQDKYAPKLQHEHTERFNNQFVAFRTILEQL